MVMLQPIEDIYQSSHLTTFMPVCPLHGTHGPRALGPFNTLIVHVRNNVLHVSKSIFKESMDMEFVSRPSLHQQSCEAQLSLQRLRH